MAKLTKHQIKEFVRFKLGNDKRWALHALTKIFEFQTAAEQEYETTSEYNGVGFTGVDGEILSSFAKQYIRRKWLSEKQMAILMKKMPKYWKQIISISDEEKLIAMVPETMPRRKEDIFEVYEKISA